MLGREALQLKGCVEIGLGWLQGPVERAQASQSYKETEKAGRGRVVKRESRAEKQRWELLRGERLRKSLNSYIRDQSSDPELSLLPSRLDAL